MNKERIEQIATSAYTEWVNCTCVDDCSEKYSEIIGKAITKAVNEALEDACKAVYGNCESDNVAKRTVEAIRRMKL